MENTAVHMVFALLVLAASASRVQEDGTFWSFLRPGQVVKRCAESTPAYEQARSRLERIDRRIQELKTEDPPNRVVRELHDLLRAECFLPAVETDRIPKPDTALSLKDWWTTAGGRDWLESFLDLPRLGRADSLTPHVVVPADARKTLDLDSHRAHPLSVLLCPLADSACGARTRGWKLRADEFFENHRALGRNSGTSVDERPETRVDVISQECAKKVSSSEATRYREWRDCIEMARPKRVALPLGEFKTPTTGWVIITGRRGHYEFCDATRAYSLTTGTAFIHDSCSGLALKPGGDVDFAATDKARVERVQVGTLPVDNLREAVWMMLLRGETEEVQLQAEYYPLPAGLIPVTPVNTRNAESSGGGMWMNTAQTFLTWRWVPTTGPAFLGELTWPASYDAAESHAASLLAIAENGFTERPCAEQRFPEPSTFISMKRHNLNEVEADAAKLQDRDFRKAAERWKAVPECPARR